MSPTSETKIRDCSFAQNYAQTDDLSMNLEELRAPLSHRDQLQRYEEGRGRPDNGFRPGYRLPVNIDRPLSLLKTSLCFVFFDEPVPTAQNKITVFLLAIQH